MGEWWWIRVTCETCETKEETTNHRYEMSFQSRRVVGQNWRRNRSSKTWMSISKEEGRGKGEGSREKGCDKGKGRGWYN